MDLNAFFNFIHLLSYNDLKIRSTKSIITYTNSDILQKIKDLIQTLDNFVDPNVPLIPSLI